MTSYSAPQANTHTRAITAIDLTNALFTNVRFVNKVPSSQTSPERMH